MDWDGVYAKDVPPDFDQMRKREDRKERIVPYWDFLVSDKEPKIDKHSFVRLMHDLKDEGNALFKENHFDIAWMHYRNALFVARVLENRFYHQVEKEFVSTLFSNRAFCCLKEEMYNEAVHDCDSAIKIFPNNLKAYYRQTVAYKHQKKYKEAMKAAEQGQQIQQSSALKELLDELQSLVEPQVRKRPPEVSSAAVSIKGTAVSQISGPQSTSDEPDADWLTGTNVGVTEKSKARMPTKKTKKPKPVTKLTEQLKNNGRMYDEGTATESEDSASSLGEDDEKFANSLKSVRRQKLGHSDKDVLNIVRPNVAEEDTAWTFPHDSDGNIDISNLRVSQPAAAVGTKFDNHGSSMGLDSFGGAGSFGIEALSEMDTASMTDTSSRRSSRSSHSPVKNSSGSSSPFVKQPSPPIYKHNMEPIPTITFPLEEFHFKLSCRQCFIKIGEGIKGFQYNPSVHKCMKDVLIIKMKNKNVNWIKVRPRPELSFYGPFKICTQFSQGQSCKVGEEKCSFPHHAAELKLWSLDREGKFNIDDFVTKCREYQIDTSEILEEVKSKQQYIPGLNYVGEKGKRKNTDQQRAMNAPPLVEQSSPKKPAANQTTQHTINSPLIATAPPPSSSAFPPMPKSVPPPANRYEGFLTPRPPPSQSSYQVPYSQRIPPAQAQRPAFMNPGNYAGPYSQPPPDYYSRGQGWSRQAPTVMQHFDQPTGPDTVQKLENPLADTYNFIVVCAQCLRATPVPGIYEYRQVTHKCEENLLAMREKARDINAWCRVRERKGHREFPGNYILCHCITYRNPEMCRYGEESCSFAHNEVEQYLWTLEKDGQFNITEFIIQNRKQASQKGFSLREVLLKHGGYFEFICRSCYYGTPPRISTQGAGNVCSGNQMHEWSDFKIMAHMGGSTGEVTVINPRGFLHKTAFFKICKWLHFCRNKVNADCRFAHSMVERDIWMLERDIGIKQTEIVEQSKAAIANKATPDSKPIVQELPQPVRQATPGATVSSPTAAPEDKVFDTVFSGDSECPFVVWEVCETCWKKGQRSFQDSNRDRCQKGHANWSRNKICLTSPSNKEVRVLPRKIPGGLNFIICKYIREKNKCGYTGGGPCQFAHSSEELDIWKWMCLNNKKTLESLVEASKAAQKKRAEAAKPKISGQSVVTVSHGSLGVGSTVKPSMPVGNFSTHYCHYCGITCNSQKQWDEHCASEKHTFNVNSDREHQWNFRQPPWGIAARSYQLCPKHMEGNKCQYSNVPDMYNLCRDAHSPEELDEWKERYEWRLMKREMARQEKVFSYMDQLLEKYEDSQSSIKVISEILDGVEVTCSGDLHIYREDKKANHTWIFNIKTENLTLEKVAMLHNRDRLHFSLMVSQKTCQIAQGDVFKVDSADDQTYQVAVYFTGGMFGSFQQWVIFDFGMEPVLCRKITVEVGTRSSHEKVRQLRQQLQFDRWTSLNREIVFHDTGSNNEVEDKLLKRYKEPTSSEMIVTQAALLTELNRHNYVPKMHKLIELEEITRHQIISSYNMETEIQCLDSIQEGVFVFAHPGELFAKVPLQENLTEDTDAGKLILTSVRTVLLAPQSNSSKVVYEASIVREENFNYDGRGREYIYLCLSPQCVKDLNLSPGRMITVEIQFQMNRLAFCRMHYAVDSLKTTDIVFPDVPKINPLRNEKHSLRITSSVLNPDQMSAVRHIVAERTGYTPPFIIFGPFGTGKTETIAQAAMILLKERPDTRILICAQSNSAADLYITEHLDNFIKKSNLSSKMRRVYFKERRVYTVSPEVQKYCILSSDNNSFDMPSLEDIQQHRIVIVTVNTALILSSIGLQGYFTHIFIDEAAQSFESETLMPLSLASEKTCVVLAGDHKQISPKVFSPEAKNQKFHVSLLERLFNYYESHSSLINEANPLNILLRINYRTKMEILRFISAIFYGGPDKLLSEANIPSVLGVTPLVFYAVQGRDVQDENSISYYNMSEVKEVVERVDELFNKWPEQWGEKNAKKIGVVTPYYDQVRLIRRSLKKKNPELRDIVVERIHNVQGKEFRALFLSTVRTSHLIETPHVQSAGLPVSECDGDGGDFGFLSDSKLLNTALTRAQSLVVTVGDPVALCAIGECVNVWRTYLKHCQNMGSLYPHAHKFESIRHQVQNLMNSPARERLLQIANQRQQQKLESKVQVPPKNPNSASDTVQNGLTNLSSVTVEHHIMEELNENGRSFVQNIPTGVETPEMLPSFNVGAKGLGGASQQPVASQVGSQPSPVRPASMYPPQPLRPPAPLKLIPQKKVERFVELGEEPDFIESKDILLQLAKVSMEEANGGNVLGMTDAVRLECVKFMEEAGHAVLYHNSAQEHTASSNKGPLNYNQMQLQELLGKNPQKFKVGTLRIESSNIVVELQEKLSYLVEIGSRSLCGEAFDNDVVVIEILGSPNGQDGKVDTLMVEGRVVGVLQQSKDPSYRSYVCTVDQDHTGIMSPLNDKMSRMYNVITPGSLQHCVNGKVCVYRFTTDKQIRFSHFEVIDKVNPNSMLFVVRYLRWDVDLHLPVGVVIGTLPAGVSVSSGMKLLEIEHNIQTNFQPETIAEVEHTFYPGFQLPADVQSSRIDLRDRWSFSIDAMTAEDLDAAYSIDENEDGSYLIGVHISDVAYYVKKGSCIDTEALNRGSSMYPLNKEPVRMLPARLSTDLCSLRPNADRVALSVLMTVQQSGEVTHALVQKTIINTKKKFSYQEAEEVLQDPNAHEDYLKSCVLVLYQISRIWRKERLGNAYTYPDLSAAEQSTPSTCQLVKEMMIMTEHQVSKVLINRFPQATPLFIQSPPNGARLNVWKQEHATDAVNSIALTKPFLEGTATCTCKVACTCIVNFIRQNNLKVRDHVDVNAALWDTLTHVTDINDCAYMQNLVVAAENHPQLARALLKLMSIQSRAKYLCSSDVLPNQRLHYSLNRSSYTHFTQPLSRYIDLVVQRMMNACINNQPCPYTQQEMQLICFKVSNSSLQTKDYEEAVHSLFLSSALKAKPLILQPILEKVKDNVEFQYPTVPDISSDKQAFKANLLGATDVTRLASDDSSVVLKWQERVYDVPGSQASSASNSGELNSDRFIYKVPPFQWQRLLIAVREENIQKLSSAVDLVRKQVCNPGLEGNFIDDVTSEVKKLGKLRHFAEFWMDFHPNAVVQVQITAQEHRGLLMPSVQLVSLTPTLDICIEHRSDPARCFADTSSVSNTQSIYQDEVTYQETWQPIINLEAACAAVKSEERVVVRGVAMKWRAEMSASGPVNYAQFSLPLLFLKERQIKLYNEAQIRELFMGTSNANCQNYFSDFFCIRYGNLSLPVDPALNDSIAQIVNNSHVVCWVGHCVVISVAKDNDLLTFNLRLQQSSVTLPDKLLQSTSRNATCTVEFIMKTPLARKIHHCLQSVGKSSVLARDIALGRSSFSNGDYRDVEALCQLSTSILQQPNREQLIAIQQALQNPFTVVRGGPGTGKSDIAVKLSVLYSQRNKANRQATGQAQVLLCAPTNAALDILSEYLLSLEGRCPHVVRVYDEDTERKIHPMSGESAIQRTTNQSSDDTVDTKFKLIALHELIRQPSCPMHQPIQEFDMLFTLYPDDMTEDQLEEYSQLVSAAEATILKDCDLILSTCSTSVASRISCSTNIQQVIIDDCSMCTELEALLPVVSYKSVKQVAVIGDENQLKPEVVSTTAAKLGMDVSLIQRYKDRAVTLTSQYRVHEGILEFPSAVFYGDQMRSGSLLQRQPSVLNWPGGRDKPLAFCHIVGSEGTLEDSIKDPSQQMLYNENEAELVASITQGLVGRFQVSEGNIAVLSPYRGQCEVIQKKLQQNGQRNVTVSTVLGAQGAEWDYVMFSTVRSQPATRLEKVPSMAWKAQNLGILADKNQINVALTRCKKGLIIIGNKDLLACDKLWDKLLGHFDQGQKLVSADHFLQAMSM